MQKSITTQELKANVGEIVDSVRLRGDQYVIHRRGKPVAAVVPLEIQESAARNRERLFNLIDGIQERTRKIPAKKIASIIDQAVAEVRAARRAKRTQP